MGNGRLAVLCAVGLTVGVTLAIGSRAAAETPIDASCTIEGEATTSPPVPITGGGGSYTFSSGGPLDLRLICSVTKGDEFDVHTVSVTSSGTYSNIACGTGTATSGVAANTINSVTRTRVPGSTDLTGVWTGVNFGYQLQFAAGQGVLTFTGGELTGGGPISLFAAGDGFNPTGNVCTTRVQVRGAVEAVLTSPNLNDPPVDPDDPVADVLPPTPPPSYPSSTCKTQGGASAVPLLDAGALGDGQGNDGVHASAYAWQPTSSKLHVCVRLNGRFSSGGRLEVDTASSPGVAPVVTTSDTDMSPCTFVVFHSTAPVATELAVSLDGSNAPNPASVCVTVGTTSQRLTVGTEETTPSPLVRWTPDPDTPGPAVP